MTSYAVCRNCGRYTQASLMVGRAFCSEECAFDDERPRSPWRALVEVTHDGDPCRCSVYVDGLPVRVTEMGWGAGGQGPAMMTLTLYARLRVRGQGGGRGADERARSLVDGWTRGVDDAGERVNLLAALRRAVEEALGAPPRATP